MLDADSIVPDFHGSFSYGIDESRRVMVPAKWRPKDSSVLFTVILWPINIEDFLLVLPPERWRVLLNKLKTRSLQDRRVAALERIIGSTSAQLTVDKQGRFCLPETLTRPAAIGDEAVFVGRLDKFEIWSPKRLKAATTDDKTVAAVVAEEIDL
jgi:division/cell wall cluster transcriptional repressor MraZ